MRINWERLGITIIGIIVIAGIFFTSIYWDPTGIIKRESHIIKKIVGAFINVIIVAVPALISFLLLASICMGLCHLFKWITDVSGLNSPPQPEPEADPQSESIEPEPPELDEVIPRAALMDLS